MRVDNALGAMSLPIANNYNGKNKKIQFITQMESFAMYLLWQVRNPSCYYIGFIQNICLLNLDKQGIIMRVNTIWRIYDIPLTIK